MAGDFRRGDGAKGGKDDFDFRKPEYQNDAPRNQPSGGGGDDGDGDCGGQVIGWVVFIAIFGGINLITSQFGFYIIPIRR
jgi:hypothetical protein